MDIRFLGQSAVELIDGEHRILVDPFLTGNPKATVSADELEPTHILLTHGHADHYGDTVEIAKRTGAPVLALVEIANELSELGVETVHDPDGLPAGRPAHHGRRDARLPPGRHGAVLGSAADRAARQPRRRGPRAD